jgi:hypothetical protein
MVAAQTVGTGGLAHARWYDLSMAGASPSLSRYGEIAPASGASTYYPAIEIAADGDLGMTYMRTRSRAITTGDSSSTTRATSAW